MIVDQCTSTNDLARDLAEKGAPHGAWISAKIQDSGRGRLGREWQSLPGNLFLSWIARIENKNLWSWVPLATAGACARAIHTAFPSIPIKIKWPNDLWINKSKCGGILCEASHQNANSFIIIGIGINCARSPKGLDQSTISIADAAKKSDFTADDLRIKVLEQLTETFEELIQNGPSAIQKVYADFSVLSPGTEITWGTPPEFTSSQSGIVVGLGNSGELIVKKGQGPHIKLFAEDVKIRDVLRVGD
ncbi:MAG: biotin--[acetyl-CoA-carboxylase] ligase [Bdellovibrionota bacterium]